MATSKKAAGTSQAQPASTAKVAPKPAVSAAAPAVTAPAAKKPVAKAAAKPLAKAPAKVAAKPVASKPATKAPAAAKPKAVAKLAAKIEVPLIDAAQRANYIEVAAYYIAQRRGFTPGDAQQDYLCAAAEVDQLIAAGHFAK